MRAANAIDVQPLARRLLEALEVGVEAGARSKLRRNKYRRVLLTAKDRIMDRAIQTLSADLESGKPVHDEKVYAVIAEAVAGELRALPSAFKRQNLLGFALFAMGIGLSVLVSEGTLQALESSSDNMKFAVTQVISTLMGYVLAVFKPYFDEKIGNQSRALNYTILRQMMRMTGAHEPRQATGAVIDAGTQGQLEEVFIGREELDARLQGVLGLMQSFSSFIGESFFKARYILDDTSNPNRLKDATDLMAGIFVTAKLCFYPLKPQFEQLFDTYIYSTLRPTLQKHAGTDGQKMFDMIMARIAESDPKQSPEALTTYFAPFVRGALGLGKRSSADQELHTVVMEILQTRANAAEAQANQALAEGDERRVFKTFGRAIEGATNLFLGLSDGPEDVRTEARREAKLGEVVVGQCLPIRGSAEEIVRTLDQEIESAARRRWRTKRHQRELKGASLKIAQHVMERLAPDVRSGRAIQRDKLEAIVEGAVKEAQAGIPNAFQKENVFGACAFAVGIAVNLGVSLWMMNSLSGPSLLSKLVVQTLLNNTLPYVCGVFNPYFNDKVASQSKALNYQLLKTLMRALGGSEDLTRESGTAVEAAIQAQLNLVYIEQQRLDGRLQGVLGTLNAFLSFIGESFFKARYMLDDENNPNRVQDACDLIAGILLTSRLDFYALKPEQRGLFNAYVYSALEPTLRKHASIDGPRMYEMIMARIRASHPSPSEDQLEKYYQPFVKGVLGQRDRDRTDDTISTLRAAVLEGALQR